PYTSKVLGWKRPGRIDSCRLQQKRHTSRYAFFLSFIEIIFSLPQDILFAFILLIYYNDDRLLYR
ncbi:hypothetical protein QUV50_07480, partial [Phascolarctobacterium faecium]|nr:hypothetical protein [Phascolarctobacterium faecium]